MPKINLDIGRKADSEKEKKPVIDIWAYAEPAGEEPDPLKRNILQWRRLITSVPDPLETFVGQRVDIIGFVHQRFQDNPSQFVLARHIIRCCLADTVPLGLVIHTDVNNNFETDTWLKVQGSFAKISVSSKLTLVVIPEQIDVIPEPQKAYINGVF
ncbi:MAG: TIGR03943 family protein [Phormidesmis priestleyi Ana]|uniref:TIGR03943 family protein n=1 Tax=Phormidesmis priestleyi Ana TaxID=1666911 RepID=A0A0P8D805_9CYAN|nr:MAG: TIGR03943 family protein [Phormidesmis priestleyi Ana]